LTTFGALFVPQPLREAVADDAWFAAMLRAESALAAALQSTGVIPAETAAAIEAKCDVRLYDCEELATQGRAVANPAEPLVRALREQVGGDEARYVHFGATSQDIVDTAAMLVTREASSIVGGELTALAAECTRLAAQHRDTEMAARTLLQQAVPTTFGYKAAVWLTVTLDARRALAALDLPAQLGGAAGTLAPYGEVGLDVLAAYAGELGLTAPQLPWHTNRAPVRVVAGAFGLAADAAAKIGLDVVLLAQSEIGEVSEGQPGGSSSMAHKRNPVRAILARASARGAQGYLSVLQGGDYEHERAAGAWQAEWDALSGALALTGAAVAGARESLAELKVDAERMRANMTGDLAGVDLGSAQAFVDRALDRYRSET
jgi:3-carboxy-cis,cis-muconate cycloisomerase